MAIPQKKTGAGGKAVPGKSVGAAAAKPALSKKTATAPSGGVSLRPKDAVAGGGLFDDFDGTILDARFVEFDYDGTIDEPVLAICLEIRNDEEEEKPEEGRGKGQNPFLEHYSAGPITNFVPSDDGLQAIPAGSKTGLSDSCNAVQLLTSVVEAAADSQEMEEKIGNSLEALHNMRAHFKRAAFKQRAGLEQDEKNKGGYKKTGPLIVETLLEGEAKKQKGAVKAAPAKTTTAKTVAKPAAAKTASKAKPAPEPEPEPEPQAEEEAVTADVHALNYIAEQLEANGGGVEKDALPKKVFKYAKDNGLDNAVRNEILEYVGNEDWLGEQTEYFEFDGETLTAI